MKRRSLIALFAAAVLASSTLVGGAARAAEGVVDIAVMKVEFIVGGSGGGGLLVFEGREYPLSVAGLSLGASAALSVARLSGTATNMTLPSDIEGNYTAVEGGAALVLGAEGSVSFTNDKGVKLDLAGVETGVDLSLNIEEFSIAIR